MVVSNKGNNILRQTNQEEQIIYDHLLKCVKSLSPEQVIDNFRCLFIQGKDYYDPQVKASLIKIINTKESEQHFTFIINRCCHILINRWQMEPQLQPAIPQLIGLFDNLPAPRRGVGTSSGRLRQLILQFTHSDYYVKLERLARVTHQNKENTNVGNLINRYPCLYEHYLLPEDSSHEDRQTVRKIQKQIQKRYEIDLSKYVTYKVRVSKLARKAQLTPQDKKLIQPVTNPTLLSDKELGKALKQFVGTVEGGYSYKELSQSFLSHSIQTRSYKTFKQDLYEYLISSVDTQYGKHKFNEKLYQKIQTILPHCDRNKPDEFLILRTTSQLMNFLVIESSKKPHHYVFVDLITNLGPTPTVGLLLKLVLISHKVKPYLEKRFSILFGHYESFTKEGVPWLVKSLENLNIAFSVNFGKADLSFLRQIM